MEEVKPFESTRDYERGRRAGFRGLSIYLIKETSTIKKGGLRVESCLLEPSLQPLPARKKERVAGNVTATSLCENIAKRLGHRVPGTAPSQRYRKKLLKKGKLFGNEDMDVTAKPDVLSFRRIGRKKRNF